MLVTTMRRLAQIDDSTTLHFAKATRTPKKLVSSSFNLHETVRLQPAYALCAPSAVHCHGEAIALLILYT
jgi:hypothetical protein